MSDEELAKWLGFKDDEVAQANAYVGKLTPEKREVFDRMRAIELWDNGFGPRPDLSGVLLDYQRRSFR